MESRLAVVVLAAGFSRRLGQPKQAILLAGETLLGRAVRTANEAKLGPVLAVVSPAASAEMHHALQECVVVQNTEAAEGMAASVRAGIQAAVEQGATGAVLMTCDQVALTADHLRALVARPEEVTASGYDGRVGVPAYFPASTFPQLLALRGDQGARELLRGVRVVQEERLALDIDTADDLRRAQAWVEQPLA